MIHLFLDTNSLLHFPPIKDVDWKTVCGCASVQLVLCLQVIHELDEKKDDPRLSDRANRAIKEIKAIRSAGGVVREGVTLVVFNHEIRAADFPTSLSLDSKDDRIVHSAKKYLEEHAGARVAVYTEDMGMTLRCEANSLPVVEPDPKRRLENPQDELTKKYRQAISELNTLKNRLPILTLEIASAGQFPQKGHPFSALLAPSWQLLDKQTELLKVQRAYPKHTETSSHPLKLLDHILEKHIGSDEWMRYNQRLDNFYLAYELFIQRLNTWGENNDRTIGFDLWLGNAGNAPANDLDVFLLLPPSLKWVAEVESDSAKVLLRPEPPEPPERPRSLLLPPNYDIVALQSITPISAQIAELLSQRDRDVVEVWNEGERGFCIHAKMRRLKHGGHHRIGSFLAVFGSWGDVKPFEAEFTISAAELPDRTTGRIAFVIRDKRADQRTTPSD
jgi:hypothetical protein